MPKAPKSTMARPWFDAVTGLPLPYSLYEGDELILPTLDVGNPCRTKTGRDGVIVANADGGTVCRPNDSSTFPQRAPVDVPGHTLMQLAPGQVEALVLKDHNDQNGTVNRKGDRYPVETVRARDLVNRGLIEVIGDMQEPGSATAYRDQSK